MPSKTKRHIIVFSPLYPPHIGGLQSHAQEWNQEMTKRGYRITVWTPHIAGGRKYEQVNNIKIIRYPAWEIISNYPFPKFWDSEFQKQWHAMIAKIRKQRTEIIIVSRTRFFFSTLIALLVAKKNRVPLIHVEHGSDFVHSTNLLTQTIAKVYDYTIGRLILKQADTVIANSEATAVFIKRLAGRSADAIISRGIKEDKVTSIKPINLSSTYNIPANTTIITYVGRLVSGKGVHNLLKAFAKISHKNCQLVIIGSGSEKQKLKNQAQALKISSRISFLGEIPWERAIQVMKSSHIIVNPSYNEGLPTSIIEASLSRRAIIATAVGGTKEIISDSTSGLLVEPGNPRQLASALTTLINDPALRQKLGDAAYTQTAGRYSWKQASSTYAHILESIWAK